MEKKQDESVKYLMHMPSHMQEETEDTAIDEDVRVQEIEKSKREKSTEIINADIEWTTLEQDKFPLATRNIAGSNFFGCMRCGISKVGR